MSWSGTGHFSGRRCDDVMRRQYFEWIYYLARALGGTICVERALGVSKGTLYKRTSGKLPIRHEAYLAAQQLKSRIEASSPEALEDIKQILIGELHGG